MFGFEGYVDVFFLGKFCNFGKGFSADETFVDVVILVFMESKFSHRVIDANDSYILVFFNQDIAIAIS
jgi:hypothetical protein